MVAIRDYWAVENAEGRRFWLFRQGDGVEAATGGLSWFLHGFF
jgi:protein ImuB